MILGITGSIGTGKSTVSKYIESRGIPVFYSDFVIHKLMNQNKIINYVYNNICPNVIVSGKIDRFKLGELIIQYPYLLKKMENVLYPLLKIEKRKFLRKYFRYEKYNVAFDIPLLFEKNLGYFCDYIIVTSVSFLIQKQRVKQRSNMTEKGFVFFLKRQWPQNKKKIHADFVLETGLSKNNIIFKIENFLKEKNFL